jgi:predicted  nucleic acid-binding Zn-ribbon protein
MKKPKQKQDEIRACKACGDLYDRSQARFLGNGSLDYCSECGLELYLNVLSTKPAKLHSAGRGCPLEPNDDASPWQDNAMRDLEG